MSTAEIAGYVASALVFGTFYMKTMLPLRVLGICSNIAFITYALWGGLTPILILHTALLPLNTIRLMQFLVFMRQIKHATNNSISIEAMFPLMTRRSVNLGEKLFDVGDQSDELYYVVEGNVWISELDIELGPGDFFGELALFSNERRRALTAIARSNGILMILKRTEAYGVLLQNPSIGIHFLKLITDRLLRNKEVNFSSAPSEVSEQNQSLQDTAALTKERKFLWLRRVGISTAFVVSAIALVTGIGPLILSIATRMLP